MCEHIKEVILILLCTGDSINLLLYIVICGCFLFLILSSDTVDCVGRQYKKLIV